MNNQVLIHQHERISVWCYPDTRVIHHQMHGHCQGEVLQHALRAGAAAMAQYGASKWLSDDRANGELPPEDIEWGNAVWIPTALRAGWKHWAVVIPRSVMAQLHMQRLVQGYLERGINTKLFTEVGPATQWLMQQ